MFLLGVTIGMALWIGYRYGYQAVAERNGDEQLALDVVGGWWNVAGDRYLELDWEGRRARLWDYSASETGLQSQGSWRATAATVIVDVTGAAGSLKREFEMVGNEAELFLAPTPVENARLLDAWIADHGEDEQAPVQAGPREAGWRLPRCRPPEHRHVRVSVPKARTRTAPAQLLRANSCAGQTSIYQRAG